MASKETVVLISNLFPLPWEPNRATFNRQQFAQISEDVNLKILVPVAIGEWLKHRHEQPEDSNVRLCPYVYLPKFGRRFYSVFMFLSLLIHSGVWLKKQKPTVLFASWAFPEAVATSWLAKLLGTKFLFKVHGSDINLHGKITARAKQIVKASQRASGVLSVSDALKSEMIKLGVDEAKIEVIYNGVDHDKFGQISERPLKEKYLLYVGNLKHDKGVFELMNGFKTIAAEYSQIHLVYAGPGNNANKLKELAKQNGLENRVKFLGIVNHHDLPAWIGHAEALCLPSYNEGVPNVVLEAMASGTPVLATTVGGIPEIVDQNKCGVLIPPKDEQAVAEGLIELLSAEWNKEEIVAHSQQFTWQKNKAKLLGLIHKQS